MPIILDPTTGQYVNRPDNALQGTIFNQGGTQQGAAQIPNSLALGAQTPNANQYLDAVSNNPGGSPNGNIFGGLGDYLGRQSIGDLAGLAGQGINAYSALFGNQNDLYKEKLGLLRQQRSSNQETLDNRRNFQQNFANASNSLANNGLQQ